MRRKFIMKFEAITSSGNRKQPVILNATNEHFIQYVMFTHFKIVNIFDALLTLLNEIETEAGRTRSVDSLFTFKKNIFFVPSTHRVHLLRIILRDEQCVIVVSG